MEKLSQDSLNVILESSEICRNAAKETMSVVLNYDEISILMIDQLITLGWKPGQVHEKTIQVWGCFLGQAMCKALNGEWVKTELGFGVAVGNHMANPLAKIEKRFKSGEAESITYFYQVFKQESVRTKSKWWPF
jgi:hypothetical protein